MAELRIFSPRIEDGSNGCQLDALRMDDARAVEIRRSARGGWCVTMIDQLGRRVRVRLHAAGDTVSAFVHARQGDHDVRSVARRD